MVKPLIQGTPPELEKKANGRVTMIRKYELITPLFGGGVKANEVDVDNPIRGTAVRGHLRFWWRATRGGQFGKSGLKAMKKREDEIWGTATKDKKEEKLPLHTQIAVRIDSKGKADNPFVNNLEKLRSDPNKKSVVPAYAAFPLQRTKEEIREGKKPHTVRKDVAFTLSINFHSDYREDIEMALWAWETFGGIGARTRRGFGALQCTAITENGTPQPLVSVPCDALLLRKTIRKQLKSVSGIWPEKVPHLSPKIFLEIIDTGGDAVDVWDWLIAALRSFRQSREGNEYGPTHWPEANAVRIAAGKTPSSKSPNIGAKFPRAQLGLPILFHFPQPGEPDDATLTGKDKERMASRLILRPIACRHKRAMGLVAALISPVIPDDGIALDGVTEIASDPVTHTMSKAEAKKIEPLDGETSLIKAFFEYIRS